MRIGRKGVDEGGSHHVHRGVGIQEFLLVGIGDEAHLEEDSRTCGLEQHPERSLLYTAVRAVKMAHEMLLHLGRELQGLIHEIILHQLEHDIRIDGIGVKAMIGCFIVRLELHHGVLAHGDIEVFLRFLGTEDEGLHAFGVLILRSIGMDGDKEVGIVLIRDIGAGLQRNEDVRGAGIDDIQIRVLLFEQRADLEHQGEVEIFLLREPPYRTRVFTAMPGIKHHGVALRRHEREDAKEN